MQSVSEATGVAWKDRIATLARVALVIALNAVPIWGLTGEGWTPGTVLALYWVQTVMSIPIVGALIFVHRRMTHKRGHYRLEREEATGSNPAKLRVRPVYLSTFLLMSTVFAVAHGVFLAFILGVVWRNAAGAVDVADLKEGIGIMAALMALGFAIELIHLRQQPFSWIRFRADSLMRRVVVVHFAIIFGMMVAAMVTQESLAFFWVFLALKLLVDVVSELPQRDPNPGKPWQWIAWIARKSGKTDEEFSAEWRRIAAQQKAGFEDAELPVDPLWLAGVSPAGPVSPAQGQPEAAAPHPPPREARKSRRPGKSRRAP